MRRFGPWKTAERSNHTSLWKYVLQQHGFTAGFRRLLQAFRHSMQLLAEGLYSGVQRVFAFRSSVSGMASFSIATAENWHGSGNGVLDA